MPEKDTYRRFEIHSSEGSVHGNGSRQPDNWRSALAEPFVTVLAHGNEVIDLAAACLTDPVD